MNKLLGKRFVVQVRRIGECVEMSGPLAQCSEKLQYHTLVTI